MKKFILFIPILFLFAGCTATYNLEIVDKKFNEKIYVSLDNSDSDSISYFKKEKFYAIMTSASGFRVYDKKVKEKKDKTNINLSYNYNSLEYLNSTALSSCFEAYNVIDENGYYIISTSQGLKCTKEEDTILLNNLKIIIKTNHKVKESNAKEHGKYTYIWEFNKDNYENAKVYMKLYKNKYALNYNNMLYKRIALYFGIPVAIALLIVFIIRSIRKRNKKANKL